MIRIPHDSLGLHLRRFKRLQVKFWLHKKHKKLLGLHFSGCLARFSFLCRWIYNLENEVDDDLQCPALGRGHQPSARSTSQVLVCRVFSPFQCAFLTLLQISALITNDIYSARVLIECVRSRFDHDTDGNPTNGEAFTSFLFDQVLSLLKSLRLLTSTRRQGYKRMGKTDYSYLKVEQERYIPEESPLAPQT
ncbi:unnamed protein product [Penicillium pancosmium]